MTEYPFRTGRCNTQSPVLFSLPSMLRGGMAGSWRRDSGSEACDKTINTLRALHCNHFDIYAYQAKGRKDDFGSVIVSVLLLVIFNLSPFECNAFNDVQIYRLSLGIFSCWSDFLFILNANEMNKNSQRAEEYLID